MALDRVAALTLDLDDTLWPVRPALVAAERALADWLAAHAPATAAGVDRAAMLALRAEVAAAHPQWQHDLSALRLETIRRALRSQGDDPALAEPAFEVFFAARQRVTLYDDVPAGLARLAARFRLVALSNGNADISRIGLGRYFHAAVSARTHGAAKPAASIFHAACAQAGAVPERVLHLGDDLEVDVAAALDAGLQGGWICRPDHPSRREPAAAMTVAARAQAHVWPDLAAVADALGC